MHIPPTPTSTRGPDAGTPHSSARPTGRVVALIGTFFLLTYLFTWWVVPLGSDSFPVFPFGPDLALVVLVAVTAGRSGFKRLGASLRRWRTHPLWYLFALTVPAAIGVGAVYATRATGAPLSAVPTPGSGLEFLLILPLMVLIGGALGEELGWRGFALPVLQRGFSPLAAVGVIFVAHAIWHLPLFLTDEPPAAAPFLIELASGGVVLAWLMNSTRVIWLPILLHGAHNMSQQAFMSELEGSDLVNVQWFTAVGWTALAIIILIASRGRLAPRGSEPLTTALHEGSAATLSDHRS